MEMSFIFYGLWSVRWTKELRRPITCGNNFGADLTMCFTSKQLSLASLQGSLIECSFGWGKGGNVTSAGWQITLCDPYTACEFL